MELPLLGMTMQHPEDQGPSFPGFNQQGFPTWVTTSVHFTTGSSCSELPIPTIRSSSPLSDCTR